MRLTSFKRFVWICWLNCPVFANRRHWLGGSFRSLETNDHFNRQKRPFGQRHAHAHGHRSKRYRDAKSLIPPLQRSFAGTRTVVPRRDFQLLQLIQDKGFETTASRTSSAHRTVDHPCIRIEQDTIFLRGHIPCTLPDSIFGQSELDSTPASGSRGLDRSCQVSKKMVSAEGIEPSTY